MDRKPKPVETTPAAMPAAEAPVAETPVAEAAAGRNARCRNCRCGSASGRSTGRGSRLAQFGRADARARSPVAEPPQVEFAADRDFRRRAGTENRRAKSRTSIRAGNRRHRATCRGEARRNAGCAGRAGNDRGLASGRALRKASASPAPSAAPAEDGRANACARRERGGGRCRAVRCGADPPRLPKQAKSPTKRVPSASAKIAISVSSVTSASSAWSGKPRALPSAASAKGLARDSWRQRAAAWRPAAPRQRRPRGARRARAVLRQALWRRRCRPPQQAAGSQFALRQARRLEAAARAERQRVLTRTIANCLGPPTHR